MARVRTVLKSPWIWLFAQKPHGNACYAGKPWYCLAMQLGTCANRDDSWEHWPIADQRVLCNDPRSNCGTHFGSSFLIISKSGESGFACLHAAFSLYHLVKNKAVNFSNLTTFFFACVGAWYGVYFANQLWRETTAAYKSVVLFSQLFSGADAFAHALALSRFRSLRFCSAEAGSNLRRKFKRYAVITLRLAASTPTQRELVSRKRCVRGIACSRLIGAKCKR